MKIEGKVVGVGVEDSMNEHREVVPMVREGRDEALNDNSK